MADESDSNVTGADYAAAVAGAWTGADSRIRSFWQSPVVMGSIHERITGDGSVRPAEYFVRRYCRPSKRAGISLGAGDGQLELEFIRLGACESMIGIDISRDRVDRANARVPDDLRGRLQFVQANLETWDPPQDIDLVVAKGVLHHIESLERWAALIAGVLGPEGLLYVDDFVGPTRFQWTDRQLRLVNRVLEALPPEFRRDLTADEERLKPAVGRPNPQRLAILDPSEARRSSEIVAVLDAHLDRVESKPYGGALYHPLFSRIMGNFGEDEAVVRVLMALDEILTDEGVLESDYLWAVYRGPKSVDDVRRRAAGSDRINLGCGPGTSSPAG